MWLISVILAVVASLVLSLDVDPQLDSALRTRQIDTGKGYLDLPILQDPDGLLYTINISIGEPAQELAVSLDTGSADLWVHDWRSPSCDKGLCAGGSFVPTLSDSYNLRKEEGFNISYFTEGDWHAGDWGDDSVTFQDGTELTSQLLGAVVNSGFDDLYRYAVMGLSFADHEQVPLARYGAAGNVLDSLFSQGFIGRRSFGLYLNDRDAAEGSLLLGGLDSAKYTGDLVALPLLADYTGRVSSYTVTVTNVSFTYGDGITVQLTPDGFASPMVLDSGTADVWINEEVFTNLAAGFGAVRDDYGYWVPCSLQSSEGTLNYGLGGTNGITVSVPMSQMFAIKGYEKWALSDESGGCWLDFAPFPGPEAGILGNSFLRSAYVVYDMDNKIAAVGQAVPNNLHTSNIVTLSANDTTIPGVARTCTTTVVNSFYTYSSSHSYTPDATLIAQTLRGVIQAGTPTFNVGEAAAGSSTSFNTAITIRTTTAITTATTMTIVTTTTTATSATKRILSDFHAIVAVGTSLIASMFV